ncbi:MAG: hypothetical protein ACQESG_05625 [Nanobdellota archaeon]
MSILCYMDKKNMNDIDDSTRYLVEGLSEQRIPHRVSYEPDAQLASDYDTILCRFDIPVKYDFLQTLVSLEDSKRFVNPPSAKLQYHTKAYLKEFSGTDILPPTYVGSDYEQMARFAADLDSVILKPINLNKGKGIEVYHGASLDELMSVCKEKTHDGTTELVAQEFISDIADLGDKRVNILFYEPVSAVHRFPAEDSFLCNLSSGGRGELAEITKTDEYIIGQVLPFLQENKIVWAGIDILGQYLGEINVASPGVVYEADLFEGTTRTRDFLIDRLK